MRILSHIASVMCYIYEAIYDSTEGIRMLWQFRLKKKKNI